MVPTNTYIITYIISYIGFNQIPELPYNALKGCIDIKIL